MKISHKLMIGFIVITLIVSMIGILSFYSFQQILRLKQILINLFYNAVKFSKKEGGTVTIKTIKEKNEAAISVIDTGIGIRKEDLGKLFKEFSQLESGSSRSYGGTGLGLAISKKLVELHGGKISVDSVFGEGTTFTFTIPLIDGRNE